jgi:hypothetical protein
MCPSCTAINEAVVAEEAAVVVVAEEEAAAPLIRLRPLGHHLPERHLLEAHPPELHLLPRRRSDWEYPQAPASAAVPWTG